MIKWFKSLSKQEKMMTFLIIILIIGVILRWDNIKKKALIWFRYDDIMEERADTTKNKPAVISVEEAQTIADTLITTQTMTE